MYSNRFLIKAYPINEVIVHNDIDEYYGFGEQMHFSRRILN